MARVIRRLISPLYFMRAIMYFMPLQLFISSHFFLPNFAAHTFCKIGTDNYRQKRGVWALIMIIITLLFLGF